MGAYHIHVTTDRHPGASKLPTGVRMIIIVNVLPSSGKARKEWITSETIEGSREDAEDRLAETVAAMRKAEVSVLRQKIEAAYTSAGMDALYVETHIKVTLTLPNMELALQEGRNVSVNVDKPGAMILTFRRKLHNDLVKEITDAKLDRYHGFDPKAQIRYEAAIADDNVAMDDDWIAPSWRMSYDPSPSQT